MAKGEARTGEGVKKTEGPPPLPKFSPALRRSAKLLLLIIAAVALFSFFYFHLDRYLAISSMKEHEAAVRDAFKNSPFATIAIYSACTILFVVCSLPAASIPLMIAGALFGLWLGPLIGALSLSIGAIISLLMARFIFRDFVRGRFAKTAAVVEREYQKSGTDYLIAMRLIPVMPYFITNLAFGLTPIPVFRFWIFSLIFSLPAAFLFGSAGTELSKITSTSDILSWRLLATLLALAALPFVARKISRRFLKVRPESS